jgi:hypothetical protein
MKTGFYPGLDYGILSGFPDIADATIFVAPWRVKKAAKRERRTARIPGTRESATPGGARNAEMA